MISPLFKTILEFCAANHLFSCCNSIRNIIMGDDAPSFWERKAKIA